MNQEKSIAKKKDIGSPSTKDFYLKSLKLVPGIMNLIPNAKMVSDVKQASDFSYSASTVRGYNEHRQLQLRCH